MATTASLVSPSLEGAAAIAAMPIGPADPGHRESVMAAGARKVNRDGAFTVVIDSLNQPTSLEFIRNTAYVVTLGGEVWKIEGVSGPPYGVSR